jgi:hypothetical protein
MIRRKELDEIFEVTLSACRERQKHVSRVQGKIIPVLNKLIRF